MNLEIGYDLNTLLGEIAIDYKLTLGENATGDTPMRWGDIVSGTVYYYVVDTDGIKTMQSSSFYFNTLETPGYVVSAPLSLYGVRQPDSGSASLYVSYKQDYITMGSGSVWNFKSNFPQYQNLTSDDISGSDSVRVYIANTGNTTFNELQRNDSYNSVFVAGFTGDTSTPLNYVTSSSAHSLYPNVPYIPISGRTMSYNDLRQYIVNEYNEQNPSETINVNDLPAFDDSTEPTNDIQPFSLDYDEILGEKEMESIIAETRYILDTTPYEIESFDYMLEASAPYEILKDAGTLSDGLIASVGKVYDLADDVVPPEIISLYAFLAFLGVGMWFLLRR